MISDKLTPAMIDDLVEEVIFTRHPLSTLTLAELKLKNGASVQGTSNVINPANFNEAMGQKVAVENAKGDIWKFEGYAIKRDLKLRVEAAARAAHEANRVYCLTIGDDSQPTWDEAPDWQKESAIAGVRAVMANPDLTPEQSHESWLAHKEADGWIWGEEKNPEKKEHPCICSYAQLPPAQRAKDAFFTTIVKAVLA